MEPKYYNLWCPYRNEWTDGYRRTNRRTETQDPRYPWKLTLQEIAEWLINDWGGDRQLTLSSSIEDCNAFVHQFNMEVRALDSDYDYEDFKNRSEHALKFL